VSSAVPTFHVSERGFRRITRQKQCSLAESYAIFWRIRLSGARYRLDHELHRDERAIFLYLPHQRTDPVIDKRNGIRRYGVSLWSLFTRIGVVTNFSYNGSGKIDLTEDFSTSW
jgi:hypothetical protein